MTDDYNDAPLKILRQNRMKRRNEFAREVAEIKYRPRVVRPDKEYSRKGKKRWNLEDILDD
jgi:Zn-finger nucleic acid-binding protein